MTKQSIYICVPWFSKDYFFMKATHAKSYCSIGARMFVEE
jgi:hypothetical protein